MFAGYGFYTVIGICLFLAWLIAGRSLVEENDGKTVRIKAYSNRYSRIASLTVLLSALALFVIYETGYPFLGVKFTVKGEAPITVIILVSLVLFWLSFNFKQLEIDKARQEFIYGQGIFFVYSKVRIPFLEMTRILVLTPDPTDGRVDDYTVYVETEFDRKYIFESNKKAEIEKVADCLKEHLPLNVECEEIK